jgi:hypothetical protein
MNKISEKQLIEETIEKEFKKSEMRFLSKEPTHYKDLKNKLINKETITKDLKTGISEIVRDSIDVQVKKSLDHGGSSFLKELQMLRFSNLDEQTEQLRDKRKSMRRIGVQMIELDEQGNVCIVEKGGNQDKRRKSSTREFDQMMEDILGKEDFQKEQKVGMGSRNTFQDIEPDKDFLFESQEMESKFLSRSSKKLRGTSPIKKSASNPKMQEAEGINYSDYYDGIFNSFLAYSNTQARNSNFNFGNYSNSRNLRESTNHKRIDVSSGLSQFLKSKIDSFVDEFTKEAVYKRGTVESMIKGVSVMKSEIALDSEKEKEGELKMLRLDDDPREKLILSDLEPIEEHEGDGQKGDK